jgi:hypothetical protein
MFINRTKEKEKERKKRKEIKSYPVESIVDN